MRTRFRRPDLGRPADGRRSSTPSASLLGHTRELSGAIVKDVGEREAVFCEKVARFLRYHRLNVNSNLRADCWASNAWRRACGQLPIKSRSGVGITLNRCRQVAAAAPARSGQARIDLVAHQFGNRRFALHYVEVDLIRYVRKTDNDTAFAIDLDAAITQPAKLVVIRHAN